MVKHLDSGNKFLMYPRFVQVFLNNQLEGMDNHTRTYVIPSHTKKVFGNMRRVGKDFSGKITPLFPTMMVQAQKEIGKGFAGPTNPHHTPTIIQPSTSQPLRKHKSRKTKRKDNELPQTSVLTEHVADEAINEEMDDSLERAITTTSLDAEQDRGHISKTQSKATPNEPSSPGTSSGGGLMHQDIMRDTIAQTRSENVSKFSNNPLLAGVNTPQSGEDSLKLTELMELYTNLQQRVFDLKTTKTSQAQEITSLKKRFKRLEKKRRSRNHGLKRLYKVRLSARVESSSDEESLGEEDASKQGRISNIDANQDIYLVKKLFFEKAVADKEVSAVKEVNAASITTPVSAAATTTTAATTPTISMDEITLDKALIEIKTSRPKAKGIVMQEPSETSTPTPIVSSQQPLKEDIQAKVDADYQLAERLHAEEQEHLTDAEKAKLFIEFMEKRRKFFTAKSTAEKRNKPPTKAQQRSIMSTYLKNIDGWKTRALKNKSFADIQDLFNKAMKRVNMFMDMDTEVIESSKKTRKIAQEGSSKRARDRLEQEIAKKQRIEDENESTELKRSKMNQKPSKANAEAPATQVHAASSTEPTHKPATFETPPNIAKQVPAGVKSIKLNNYIRQTKY
nr:protein SPIRAL1-like 1 [Tanacetum cinerariifolium]